MAKDSADEDDDHRNSLRNNQPPLKKRRTEEEEEDEVDEEEEEVEEEEDEEEEEEDVEEEEDEYEEEDGEVGEEVVEDDEEEEEEEQDPNLPENFQCPTPLGLHDLQAVKKHEGDKSTGTEVTLGDVDVLDCPICFEPLRPPVFQCDNGHVACDSCCKKIRHICPSCSKTIGFSRCRVIERVVQSASVLCVHRQHGCKEKVSYLNKLDHERVCKYVPIKCPRCEYFGASLYSHFGEEHPSEAREIIFNSVSSFEVSKDQYRVLFQERDEKVLFILNRTDHTLGCFVNIICLAPTSSNMKYSYKITSRSRMIEKIVSLETLMELSPNLTGQSPQENGLLISDPFVWGCSGPCGLLLELIIKKPS